MSSVTDELYFLLVTMDLGALAFLGVDIESALSQFGTSFFFLF
jgi:hypothetical protein